MLTTVIVQILYKIPQTMCTEVSNAFHSQFAASFFFQTDRYEEKH